VSKREEIDAFAAYVRNLGRPVDVLVNNAGYFIPGQIHNEAEGTLESMLAANLSSVYHLTRGLLPDMMARRDGHIFNLCSTASITAYTNGGSYCISKFALYGLTKVLRAELREHADSLLGRCEPAARTIYEARRRGRIDLVGLCPVETLGGRRNPHPPATRRPLIDGR
jgi:short-subunit dehydrogenase involved in D-alanine esterification of teichoic acids